MARQAQATRIVPASHLGPAVVWLRDRGVGVRVIASALGTTDNHVRVLDWRGRQANDNDSQTISVTLPPAELGIRPDEGIGVVPRTERIDWTTAELERIRSAHAARYDFAGGITALNRLRPYIGRPASAEWVRVLARLFEHRAWFAVHSGFTRTALDDSGRARALSLRAYRETESPIDLKRAADASLVASNALLYVDRPDNAFQQLAFFRKASERARNTIGSEYHRQLGLALVLRAFARSISPDDAARKLFGEAMVAMERFGEAQNATQVLLSGRRHLNLLGSTIDVDAAGDLVDQATQTFGFDSLEAVIATNYLAACRLATDGPTAHRDALTMLKHLEPRAKRFRHQLSVLALLSLTPALQLSGALRVAWAQQVFFLNAFRRY